MNNKLLLTMLLVSFYTTVTNGLVYQKNSDQVWLENKIKNHDLKARKSSNKALIVFTVGADGACQYNSIGSALGAANNNSNSYEIRLAYNKTYFENFNITQKNLTLKGGYSNCSNAANDVADNTSVELQSTSITFPVITISNVSSNSSLHSVKLINLTISEGSGNSLRPGGGISVVQDYIDVTIENSFIHNNAGIKGGGIYIQGSHSSIELFDTLLLNNSATNGGGLYCDAADVIIYGDSGIALNAADGNTFDGNGGGVYATNSCTFQIFSGTKGGFLDFRGIAGNTANRNGGGLYADKGSLVFLWGNELFAPYGNNIEPVNITGNKANMAATVGSGGGIFATDLNTVVKAYATIINNNEVKAGVKSNAGALYISDQAEFDLKRLAGICWNELKCNQIINNQVFGGNSNAAGLMAFTSASVKIRDTWISQHQAHTNAFMYEQYSSVLLEGNVFTGNGGSTSGDNDFLLSLWGDAGAIDIGYNTFVGNTLSSGLIKLNQDPSLTMYADIIKESSALDVIVVGVGSTTNAQINCSIVSKIPSIASANVFVQDPLFVNEANEDFHLRSLSPAIDMCSASDFAVSTKDTDRQARGWDDPLKFDLLGTYDAGVDEYYPITNADLSIDKSLLSTPPFYKGQSINYQINVSNNGADDATGVFIEDFPTAMTLTSVNSPNCTALPCYIDTLNNGETEQIQVSAQLNNFTGNFDNSAAVYSADFDPNTSDNSDNSNNGGVILEDFADLDISDFSLVTPGPYHSGQIINYHLSVQNLGPNSARNVSINDNGFNVELLNIAPIGGSCVNFPCDLANFPVNMSIDMQLSVRIISGGDFDYAVSIVSDSTDSDPSNNSANISAMHAENTADLAIDTQLIGSNSILVGHNVEFNLILSNLGSLGVSQITVDANTSNLTVVAVSGAGCSSLPCQGLTLTSGESQTINVSATVLALSSFSLQATIDSGNGYDPDISNNNSSANGIGVSEEIFMDSFE